MLMGSEDVLNAKEGMIEQEQRNTEPENRIVRAVCGISLTGDCGNLTKVGGQNLSLLSIKSRKIHCIHIFSSI